MAFIKLSFNFSEMDSMNVPMDNSNMSFVNQSISVKECLDLSGKVLDRFFAADDSFPTLLDKMQISHNG